MAVDANKIAEEVTSIGYESHFVQKSGNGHAIFSVEGLIVVCEKVAVERRNLICSRESEW